MPTQSDHWPVAAIARRRWTPTVYDDLRFEMDEAIDQCRNDRWPVGWLGWQIKRITQDARAIRATRTAQEAPQ